MNDNKNKTENITELLFSFTLNHDIRYEFKNGELVFDVDDQHITITRLEVTPDLILTKMSALAEYRFSDNTNNVNASAIIDATKYLKTSLSTIKTKTNLDDVTVKKQTTDTDLEDKKQNKDSQDTQDSQKVQESESIKNIKEVSVNIITDSLKIAKQVKIRDDNTFSVEFKPSEITKFINFRESKKIKIFVNGIEKRPMEEKEFISRILPFVNLEITLK